MGHFCCTPVLDNQQPRDVHSLICTDLYIFAPLLKIIHFRFHDSANHLFPLSRKYRGHTKPYTHTQTRFAVVGKDCLLRSSSPNGSLIFRWNRQYGAANRSSQQIDLKVSQKGLSFLFFIFYCPFVSTGCTLTSLTSPHCVVGK